jgi:hypothetical protein
VMKGEGFPECLMLCERRQKVTEGAARLRVRNVFAKGALVKGCMMKSRPRKSAGLVNGELTEVTEQELKPRMSWTSGEKSEVGGEVEVEKGTNRLECLLFFLARRER